MCVRVGKCHGPIGVIHVVIHVYYAKEPYTMCMCRYWGRYWVGEFPRDKINMASVSVCDKSHSLLHGLVGGGIV